MRALEVAVELGTSPQAVEEASNGKAVEHIVSAQLQLAASLGFAATPSFLIAGAGVLGYPGPKALSNIVASVRACDQITC